MLIVETLIASGSAAQAGLQVGDHLWAYNAHPLTSPALLQALSENAAHSTFHSLQISRHGEELTLLVTSGTLGLEARPVLPAEVLLLYQAGQEAQRSDAAEEAIALWTEAAEMSEPPSIPAWLWTVIGKIREKQNLWLQAQTVYERAEQLLQDAEDRAAQYVCAMGLGRCFDQQKSPEHAQERYVAALALAGDAGYDLWAAASFNNLGIVTYHRGDLAAAENYHRHALAIRERLAPGSMQLGKSFHHLGNVAYQRGELATAEDCYNHALEIMEQCAPDTKEIAYCLQGLGVVANQRSDFASAQDYHRRALALWERFAPDSLSVATCLHSLSCVAYVQGDLALAENYQRRALAIRERLAPGSKCLADSLQLLGGIATDRGEFPAAEALFLKALEIEERLVPKSVHLAVTLNNLGQVARHRGDLVLAENYYRRALALWERFAPDSLRVATCLHNLARTSYQQQHFTQALPLHQRSLAIVESQRSQIVSSETRSLLLAQHIDKYLGLLETHLALDNLAGAFAVVERARARSLVEMLAERALDFTRDAPAELLQQQRQLDQHRGQTYSSLVKLDARADTQQVQSLQTQLQELERQQQQLTAQIRATSPRYATLQYPQPLDLAGVQAMLDPGTLALVYQTNATETYLFAVTRDLCELHRLSIGREELARQVAAFRTVLDVRLLENTLQDVLTQGQSLYATLLAPANAALKKADRLLLCPEGPLSVLPFACLVSNQGRKPRYLGEEKPLHQTVSLTVYAQLRPEKQERRQAQNAPSLLERIETGAFSLLQAGKRLLALGDPLYPPTANVLEWDGARGLNQERQALESRGLTLSPLPYSRQEVEGIGHLFGAQATLRLGAEATKTSVKQECGQASILHFACHGWLDHRFPLSSALVLTQPEMLGEQAPANDNGLLQAWEVLEQMRLEAELVVLSACETGLGQEVRGEGLIGLTRAFQYAGARSVLVSLWEIHDASTSHFMQAFYEALAEGSSKDVALQHGIEVLRRHPEWSHPYYWGAFALQGDWEA